MNTSTTKDTGGMTIERFSDRLAVYLKSQSAVESLRDTDMPQFPWPNANNPMLEYLVHRSEEMAESDGRPASVVWLAVHAWFEGALRALAVVAPRTEACPTPDSSWFDNLRSNASEPDRRAASMPRRKLARAHPWRQPAPRRAPPPVGRAWPLREAAGPQRAPTPSPLSLTMPAGAVA